LLKATSGKGVFLATAHPAKFPGVYAGMGIKPEVPHALRELSGKPVKSLTMQSELKALADVLSSFD
jgi:hypothetical protein